MNEIWKMPDVPTMENLKGRGRDCLGDLGIDGRIILKWI
jgi:hypothetical protein